MALFVIALSILPLGEVGAAPSQSPFAQASDAYELIDAINALRAANGLPAYNVHPILMGTAQGQASYMASAGTVTHYGPDGSRPYQRALAAGYPLAGDLSRGGFFSENITAGNNLSAQSAVNQWLGDAPHTNTMLSTYAQDIGAGVATVGSQVYYVIDVGLATSSTPRYTPGPDGTFPTAVYYAPLVSTIVPNTPAADGIVRHKVKGGETLWLIAITYGTKVDSIRALNGLSPDSPLRAGQELLIFPAGTVTPPPSMRVQPTMLALLATATGASASTPAEVFATDQQPSSPRPDATASPDVPGRAATGISRTTLASSRPSGLGIAVLVIGGSLLVAAILAFRARGSS
jgi:uncharacterized protein YkwD